MKSTVVIAVLILVIGSAFGQTPPLLLQQYTANFTVSFDFIDPNEPQVTNAGGVIYFAWIKGALSIKFGYHVLGQYDDFNVILSPRNGFATLFGTECSDWCRQYGEPVNITLLNMVYPYEIPDNSAYIGDRTFNGEDCSGWKFIVNFFGVFPAPVTAWVAEDGTIAQVEVEGVNYWNIKNVYFTFSDMSFGSFPPSVFAPPTKANPNLQCPIVPF